MNRYSPYKLKPQWREFGGLIASQYANLRNAVADARQIAKQPGCDSVEIVARPSGVLLAIVDQQGNVHTMENARHLKTRGADHTFFELKENHANYIDEPVFRSGKGPTNRTYHERLFKAVDKMSKRKLPARVRRTR